MADQTTLNNHNASEINAPADGVVGNIAEFVNDISTLGELQFKLGMLDLKEATGRATTPSVLLGVGALLVVAGVPVVLLGVAELIATAGVPRGWAFVLTGLTSLVIAGVMALLAIKGLGHSFTSFRRSRDELTRNLSWVKTVIVYSGRAVKPVRR